MRKASYTTHEGITVNFNTLGSPYTLNPLPFRSFEAEPTILNNRISDFSTDGVKNFSIEIGTVGTSAQETADNYDYLFSLFDTDILAVLPGTLTVNGYSLNCYINRAAPQLSLRRGKQVICTVTTEKALWYKELFTVIYTPESSLILNTPVEFDKLTYPHGYSVGYPSVTTTLKVKNPALRASHFRLIIEGPVTTPTVIIGGHTYSADVTVPSGSKLIIGSRTETVVLVDESGTETNVFNKRNRNSYCFEKIPPGESSVAFRNIDRFFLTIIDERRYPQWST